MKKPLESSALIKPTFAALLVATLALALAMTSAFAQSPEISTNGRWLTESGNLEVDIANCNGALCGTVAKAISNRSMGAPGTEIPVAEAAKLVGMVILSNFKPTGASEWKGEIFNRENGKHYSALMSMPEQDQLVIRTYIGLPLFGKTQVWRRIGAAVPAQ